MVPHHVKEPPRALHIPWGLPIQPSCRQHQLKHHFF